MISAMSGFITFLIIVGLVIVVLEYSRRRRDVFVEGPGDRGLDRDRERVLHDLRASERD